MSSDATTCSPGTDCSTAVSSVCAMALAEHGVKPENLRDLAEMAAKQWTAQFNPRQLNLEDFVELYRSAL